MAPQDSNTTSFGLWGLLWPVATVKSLIDHWCYSSITFSAIVQSVCRFAKSEFFDVSCSSISGQKLCEAYIFFQIGGNWVLNLNFAWLAWKIVEIFGNEAVAGLCCRQVLRWTGWVTISTGPTTISIRSGCLALMDCSRKSSPATWADLATSSSTKPESEIAWK